jgi:uncharacterized LabA/DUF88 family protein
LRGPCTRRCRSSHPTSNAGGPGTLRFRFFFPRGHPRSRPPARPVLFLGYDLDQKNRVAVFVDGFNLYHAIDDLDIDPITARHRHSKHFLKWLDIVALSKALIHPKRDELVSAHYFSAFAGWIKEDAKDRHRSYVAALKSTGVVPVMGTFKRKPRTCPSCKHKWDGHEEKESDVNLAIHLVKLSHEDAFDKAIIFTADTDLAPAIRTVRATFPQKDVRIAIPEMRLNRSNALESAASGRIRITESHFARNLFPEKITLADGGEIIRPKKYTPPKLK